LLSFLSTFAALFMAIFDDIRSLPRFRNAVITIGTFDGVHLGHKAILKEVAAHAQKVNGESVLLTFEPHPRKLLFPDQPLGIITPLSQKLKFITEAGIQHVVIVPFTLQFAALSAHDYVKDFLVGIFHPHSIVIGYDHRFGHDRTGDLKLLEQYTRKFGFELTEIAVQLIDDAAVSSTKIRKAIQEGRVNQAAEMLGRNYSLIGTVTHGNKLGRTLGYPTANLNPVDKDQIIPANGIYAIRALHGNIMYDGMMSIGFNPTVSDTKELKIEANLFEFDSDIYGDDLEIFFVDKLRDEQKFESLDALVQQLHNDKIHAVDLLKNIQ
jgi:riboflavin kinase / FMN adenylyltransferase